MVNVQTIDQRCGTTTLLATGDPAAVDRWYEGYLKRYPPAGYATWTKSQRTVGTQKELVVCRHTSCD